MKKTFILYTAVLLAMVGCKKELLDTAPYDQLASSNMWSSDNLTDLGVNGVYNALRLSINTSTASGNELYQLDRFGFTGQTRDPQALLQGTILPNNGLFSSNWQNFYEGIQRANDAILNIPLKSPSAEAKKGRLLAEAKFLRAYFYFQLNVLWKGVPVYLEPFSISEATRPRETEAKVWEVVLKDLTDAINEPNLPNKYAKGNTSFGRVTKSAAYALRGKAYIYQGQWAQAAADFAKVKEVGHALFPNYIQLFKEANEQSDEMIFSIQNTGVSGLGSTTQWFVGTRSSFGSCWNTYLASPNLVDLYELADGTPFNWDNFIPGFNSMTPAARQVYFLRDNMTTSERNAAAGRGADMTKYLPTGNEARIRAAYEGRDSRLAANVITPYSSYNGVLGTAPSTVISRFPYRTENSPSFDLRTDTQTFFYYLYRKFVYEGNSELLNRSFGPIDYPVIRYADVLLMWAEALNESGDLAGAISKVNEVRKRAGMPDLQQTDATKPTYVANQADCRERIRNERRKEFPNEGINYFDELRWKTWKDKVFTPGAGVKQIWGQNTANYSYAGDYLYTWPIPQVEIERNPNLKQNDGWPN